MTNVVAAGGGGNARDAFEKGENWGSAGCADSFVLGFGVDNTPFSVEVFKTAPARSALAAFIFAAFCFATRASLSLFATKCHGSVSGLNVCREDIFFGEKLRWAAATPCECDGD